MIVQPGDRRARHPHIQYNDLAGVHGDGRQVVGILLVPGEPQKWCVLRVFVDDCWVLQVTQVKHSHRSIGTNGREHIPTTARPAEGYVVDFLVVGYELRLEIEMWISEQ